MRPATAFQSVQRVSKLLICWIRRFAQERNSCHDPAIDAVPALRHLFCDVRFLNWMELAIVDQPFEGSDFHICNSCNRRYAGSYRRPFNQYRAASALAKAATEMRIVQSQLISQHVKQQRFFVRYDRVRAAVHS